MNIVFLYPPSVYLNHSMFKHYTYFAETIELISRKYGDVIVKDCAVEMTSREELIEAFRNADWVISIIEPYNIISTLDLLSLAKMISQHCKTIVYGTAATLFPNYLSKFENIDYIIANGEFAQGICDSIDRNSGEKIYYPVILPGNHEWGCSLDSNAPLDKYMYWGKGMFEVTVQVGCPYNCSFCSEKVLFASEGKTVFEQRPTDEIVEMLKRVKGKFSSVYFSATTFTYDREWVVELCEKIIKEKCIVPWRSDTRINCLDAELVGVMQRAGLKQLSLGVESLDDDLLRVVNKCQTSKEIIDCIKMCRTNHVDVKALLILGIPGQTATEVRKTQEVIRDLRVPYRWKEYSPIREINLKDRMKMDISSDIEKFSRTTYAANSIEGLSSEEYMELLFPTGYIR